MKKDESTEEPVYWGNMWGWKLSYLGLALIILMLSLMGIRKCQLEDAGISPTQIEATDE